MKKLPRSPTPKQNRKAVFLTVLLITVCCISCSRRAKRVEPTTEQNNSPTIHADVKDRSSVTRTLVGIVVAVTDGDTIEILDESKESHRIRLKGIDAPEKRQAFGSVSRQNLAMLVAGKEVRIEWQKLDRNRRIVGKVFVDGQDVCLEQIKAGLAWHFRRFENEQSAEDQLSYAQAEQNARTLKVGLWLDSSQIPPWDYRN